MFRIFTILLILWTGVGLIGIVRRQGKSNLTVKAQEMQTTSIPQVTFTPFSPEAFLEETFGVPPHLPYDIQIVPSPTPSPNVIIVNTVAFVDESETTCTLGEAIDAANRNVPVGGCAAGSSWRTDQIIIAPEDCNTYEGSRAIECQ